MVRGELATRRPRARRRRGKLWWEDREDWEEDREPEEPEAGWGDDRVEGVEEEPRRVRRGWYSRK
jgi:hypothetical protein